MGEKTTKAERSKRSESTNRDKLMLGNYENCNQHMSLLKKFGDFNIVTINM